MSPSASDGVDISMAALRWALGKENKYFCRILRDIRFVSGHHAVLGDALMYLRMCRPTTFKETNNAFGRPVGLFRRCDFFENSNYFDFLQNRSRVIF